MDHPFVIPTNDEIKEITDRNANGGRPTSSNSVAELIMHPAAMSFCDETMREKLLLIREYRRYDPETGLLKAKKSTDKPPIPTHPLFKTLAFLRDKMAEVESDSAIASLASKIASTMQAIEKEVATTQAQIVSQQMQMAKLIADGGSKDLADMTEVDAAEKQALDDAALLEQAKAAGLDGSTLERFANTNDA